MIDRADIPASVVIGSCLPMLKRLLLIASALLVLETACSKQRSKADPDNAVQAAKDCRASPGDVALTTNGAVDSRPYWLSVRRGKVDTATFTCLDAWSRDHLGSSARLVDELPMSRDAARSAISPLPTNQPSGK
jgi:hypothetical protein